MGGLRLGQPLEGVQGIAAVAVRLGKIGAQRQGTTVVLERLVELLQFEQRDADIAQRAGIFRIELECAPTMPDRFLRAAPNPSFTNSPCRPAAAPFLPRSNGGMLAAVCYVASGMGGGQSTKAVRSGHVRLHKPGRMAATW
jgi:hypothetical protein